MEREFYKEIRNTSRDYPDRYRKCTLLEDKDTGEILLSTREIKDIPENPDDIYHRVQSHEVARLDILAAKYYRNPLLWWIIAQANDIFDPLVSLNSGDIVRIPTLESLYGNNGILL